MRHEVLNFEEKLLSCFKESWNSVSVLWQCDDWVLSVKKINCISISKESKSNDWIGNSQLPLHCHWKNNGDRYHCKFIFYTLQFRVWSNKLRPTRWLRSKYLYQMSNTHSILTVNADAAGDAIQTITDHTTSKRACGMVYTVMENICQAICTVLSSLL